jgi:hypothetical protein
MCGAVLYCPYTPTKGISIKMFVTIFGPLFIWVGNLVCHIEGGREGAGFLGTGGEGDIGCGEMG